MRIFFTNFVRFFEKKTSIKMDILQEIKNYLAECRVFYLATVDGDQARVVVRAAAATHQQPCRHGDDKSKEDVFIVCHLLCSSRNLLFDLCKTEFHVCAENCHSFTWKHRKNTAFFASGKPRYTSVTIYFFITLKINVLQNKMLHIKTCTVRHFHVPL